MNYKFLIFRPHEYSGFGNVIVGLVPAFFYAILSKRILLIKWPGHQGCNAKLTDLLSNPVPELQWNYYDYKEMFANCTYSIFEKEVEKLKELHFTVSYRNSFPAYKSLVCSRDYEREFRDKRVILIEAAQYFAPLMYAENQHYRSLFINMFGHRKSWLWKTFLEDPMSSVEFFGPVANWLLKLHPKIQERLDEQKEKLFKRDKKTFILGVHIRKNIRELLFYNTPVEIFWKCINDRIAELQSNDPELDIKIFLSTDYLPAKREASRLFKNRLTTFEKDPQDNRGLEAVANSLIELWLLSQCDDLIGTEKSTFSHIAHGLMQKPPLVVRWREGEFEKNPKCTREITSEPAFHLYFRAKNVKCVF